MKKLYFALLSMTSASSMMMEYFPQLDEILVEGDEALLISENNLFKENLKTLFAQKKYDQIILKLQSRNISNLSVEDFKELKLLAKQNFIDNKSNKSFYIWVLVIVLPLFPYISGMISYQLADPNDLPAKALAIKLLQCSAGFGLVSNFLMNVYRLFEESPNNQLILEEETEKKYKIKFLIDELLLKAREES